MPEPLLLPPTTPPPNQATAGEPTIFAARPGEAASAHLLLGREEAAFETPATEGDGRFQQLIEAIPHLSWTCEANGRCDYLSQQWVLYTGRPEAEQLGDGWLQAIHPDDQERARVSWNKACQDQADYCLEFRIRAANGSYRWFRTRGIPLRDERGKIMRWFGTCTDMQEIMEARLVLSRDREKLELLVQERTASLAEATEQLNTFCYSIAHDLRAPLRAQNGYAKVLLEDFGPALGEVGRGFARQIIQAAEKLEQLVDDLLSHVSLSRSDLPVEVWPIAPLLHEVIAEFLPRVEKEGGSLEVGPSDGVGLLNVPTFKLVLANLISNALKYTQPGEPPRVRVWVEPRGSQFRIWVEDDGLGIDPAHHEKIFGVFERLHGPEQYQGTGIGLAIVRKGMERMRGASGVESELGHGSRFWIELARGKLS